MEKDTLKIVNELKLCPDFNTFYNENKDYMVTNSLSEMLGKLLLEKNLKNHRLSKLRNCLKYMHIRFFQDYVYQNERNYYVLQLAWN